MDVLPWFSAILTQGNNFCGFLLASVAKEAMVEVLPLKEEMLIMYFHTFFALYSFSGRKAQIIFSKFQDGSVTSKLAAVSGLMAIVGSETISSQVCRLY